MKKVVYILFAVTGLLAASCSKENIRPTAQTCNPAPEWKRSTTETTGDTQNATDSESGITDPNSDSDDRSRRKLN